MSGDLPGAVTRVTSGSLPLLLEAIGPGPSSEHHVSSVDLYAVDAHSGTSTSNHLTRNSDGTTPYSCERWLRVCFSPPFGVISRVRFWVDNYAPVDGWEVNWGLSSTYNTPRVGTRSQIALSSLPLADPGVDKPNIVLDSTESLDVGSGETLFTDWIVLQATWNGVSYGLVQATPLNLNFAWREL